MNVSSSTMKIERGNIMTTTEAVNTMTSYVNSFICDYDEFAEKMGMEHPTLQQNFTKLCCAWLRHLATTDYWDARNKASVDFAKSIKDELWHVVLPTV